VVKGRVYADLFLLLFLFFCGSEPAREGGLTADQYLPDAPSPNCGSWLACEDGLTADQSLANVLAPELPKAAIF
jgi:hypothetical protein